ncbi:MAG: IS630 family transposase [Archaeoglobaceae archaeon]
MPRSKYEVVKHLTVEDLDARIKKLEKSTRVLKRLYFIRHLYKGMGVEESADLVGVTKKTGYDWLKAWNSRGYEGLIPEFGGGRPPKLSDEEKEELKEMLEDGSWTTREVQRLIKEKFGVSYSLWQVRRILKSFGMSFAKPNQRDYRRPEDAEDRLKNLSEVGICKEDTLGFVDQMAVEANANTARLWSFGKPVREVATYLTAKATGFYALNGNNVLEFPANNKTGNFIAFLEKVRENNPKGRIVMILDNFSTHHAVKVKEKAEELNIALIYLPPYSPHLNPIEFVWKSIKRLISQKSPLNKVDLVNTISEAFNRLTKSISYARKWTQEFLDNWCTKLCT